MKKATLLINSYCKRVYQTRIVRLYKREPAVSCDRHQGVWFSRINCESIAIERRKWSSNAWCTLENHGLNTIIRCTERYMHGTSELRSETKYDRYIRRMSIHSNNKMQRKLNLCSNRAEEKWYLLKSPGKCLDEQNGKVFLRTISPRMRKI